MTRTESAVLELTRAAHAAAEDPSPMNLRAMIIASHSLSAVALALERAAQVQPIPEKTR